MLLEKHSCTEPVKAYNLWLGESFFPLSADAELLVASSLHSHATLSGCNNGLRIPCITYSGHTASQRNIFEEWRQSFPAPLVFKLLRSCSAHESILILNYDTGAVSPVRFHLPHRGSLLSELVRSSKLAFSSRGFFAFHFDACSCRLLTSTQKAFEPTRKLQQQTVQDELSMNQLYCGCWIE